jgi:regulator of sigma E protease
MPFGNTPSNLLAFAIVLGFLIFAHESGHFFVAKFFKVRVLVFSFGFGKRLFGFRRGDTDYRVSLIPLGGYVRMAGDTPEEAHPAAPDEFLSKPKWQRLAILFAGPFINLVLAISLLALVNMAGVRTSSIQAVLREVLPNMPAAKAGLQPFDKIVSVDDDPVEDWPDVQLAITMKPGTPIRIGYERRGVRAVTTVVPERVETEHGAIGRIGVSPYVPAIVTSVDADSLAEQAGFRSGDRIVRAAGQPVDDLYGFYTAVDAMPPHPIDIVVQRGSGQQTLKLTSGHDALRNLGIPTPSVVRRFGAADSFRESFRTNWKTLRYMMVSLGRLFHDRTGVKQMAGPVTIARLSGEVLRSGWRDVLQFMALISLNLGVLNLLPIPVLDGGHIAILLVESAARRDLPMQAKERALQFGFALLALFMIVVLYFDVVTNIRSVTHG